MTIILSGVRSAICRWSHRPLRPRTSGCTLTWTRSSSRTGEEFCERSWKLDKLVDDLPVSVFFLDPYIIVTHSHRTIGLWYHISDFLSYLIVTHSHRTIGLWYPNAPCTTINCDIWHGRPFSVGLIKNCKHWWALKFQSHYKQSFLIVVGWPYRTPYSQNQFQGPCAGPPKSRC